MVPVFGRSLKLFKRGSGGMAELANSFVIHPRDPGSNLGKYFSSSIFV
jgi:hypothetical protein